MMNTTCRHIFSYCISHSVVFCMMAFMLFLPMYSWDRYNVAMPNLIFRLMNDAALCGVLSLVIIFICAVLSAVAHFWSRIVLIISYSLVWLATFSELLIIKFFQTRYATHILQVVDETNGSETFEFFCGYFISVKFFVISLFYIVVPLLSAFFLHRFVNASGKWQKIVSSFYVVIFLLPVIRLCFSVCGVVGYSMIPFGNDSFSQLYHAYSGLEKQRGFLRQSEEAHLNIEVDSCSYTSPKIVLMIGESYIKRHSPLYGYQLNTTPYLFGLDSLYIFKDVITSVNTTTLAIRNFLSLSSVGSGKEWYELPYFMAYFKKSGYHVTFYSNQYPLGSVGVDGSFLDQPNMNNACFDFRNTQTYQYDGDFLDHYEQDRSKIDVGDKWLTIIHFMGQHMMSKERYPESASYFTADSINRPDLSESQRWEIAYYDNATRYNDQMVKRVIEMYEGQEVLFVYLADHGDEVYDFRNRAGRNFDISAGADMLHCHMDVPLLIYATPEYRSRHADLLERIGQSVDRPFMTDDLPHLMLDLAGIYTPTYCPQRSVVNDSFDMSRKRLVGYENKHDYDAVCRHSGL